MQAIAIRRMESPTEMEELVRRAQAGDVDAFEAIYRQTSRRIYALCRRITRDAGRAEEMTQETYLRAWTRLETYRAGTRFQSWLSKVAVNVTLSEARSRGRRARRETEVGDPDTWDPPSPRPGPGHGIDLERAIDALPPGARKVYVLHDVEGLRHQEIAAALGVSTGTSKAQLHRARRLLREALTT